MEVVSNRLRPLLRTLLSPSSQLQLQIRRLFSSSSSEALSRRYYSDDSEEDVYGETLKSQRPCTICWQKARENSVSFIGTVDLPLKKLNTRDGSLGVRTLLRIDSSPDSYKSFWMLLTMWNEMAQISLQHLKPNDYIYVSGHLGSYKKADENGILRLRQKVIVKEINYVADDGQRIGYSGDTSESFLEKRINRLHLWQIFFANPYEWQDLRKHKENPKLPDFRHKGTGEALWLSPFDPPWVMKQLQLQDSRMMEMGLGRHQTYTSKLTPLSYNDL